MSNTGHVKQEAYATQKSRLKKALANEFYCEAIFIEYAIVEDRLESLLKHADVKYLNNDGNPISIKKKLNKIRTNPAFNDKYIKSRLTDEFLDSITEWKDKRSGLVHSLMKQDNDLDGLKTIALEGKDIVNRLDSKVKSINNHCFKDYKENKNE